MEISVRALFSDIHGMLFGGFFLMAIFAVVVELFRSIFVKQPSDLNARGQWLKGFYLIVTVGVGWAAVILGAYIVYPWYRAIPPAGVTSLAGYPQRLLLSNPATSGWHEFGMEWKEHIAWFAPMAMTMVAYVMTKHKLVMYRYPQIRSVVLVFALVALFAGSVAGFFGAMTVDHAPVNGGAKISLVGGCR